MPNKTIWTRLLSDRDVSVCEELDQILPSIPPRSSFYCLPPLKTGTSTCESLASYFLRLAEAHCVTPRVLFEKSLKKLENERFDRGLIGPNSSYGTWQINGNGLVAEKWVNVLEAVTLRQSLQALSFVPFRDAISKRDCYRPVRAWCPLCLETHAQEDETIYEQLVWSHKLVKVCSIHNVRLQTRCPHCQKVSRPLSGSMRPGKCPSCDGWLGAMPTQFEESLQEANPTEYELFISREVGGIIGSEPSAAKKFNASVPKAIISELVNRCFEGNTRAFTRYLGFSRNADTQLRSKRPSMIGLSLLLKLAFVSQTPLLDLLTNKQALLSFSPKIPPTQRPLSIAPAKERVLAGLVAAGHEMPPPSLAEVATRLDRSISRLRYHSAETCKLITKNFLNSERGRKTLIRRRGRRLRSTSDIEAAMSSAMKQDVPPTVDQVAQSLVYKNRFALKYRVPELYQALLERHEKPHIARRYFVESELKKSLQSNPPEELLAVAKRLGYVSSHELGLRYKELSRKVRSRFEDYRKRQLVEHLRLKLASILSEMPPPTLKDTLHRLGRSDGWMRAHFPEERRSIAARYLAHRREQSMASKTKEKER